MIRAFWQRFKIVLTVCGVLSLVHVINMGLGGHLNQFGILPRDPNSLPYIYSSPLLHGNLTHLINNLIGLAIFSWLCLLRTVRLYVWSSLFIVTLTGILVWLFGRPAMHIGASGWIFGLWSLSIALAWFDRRPLNIFIALVVIVSVWHIGLAMNGNTKGLSGQFKKAFQILFGLFLMSVPMLFRLAANSIMAALGG